MKYNQKKILLCILFSLKIIQPHHNKLSKEEREKILNKIKAQVIEAKEKELSLQNKLNEKNNSENIITLRKTSKEVSKENISTIINLPHCTINNNPNSQSSLQSLDEEIQQPKTLFSQVKDLLCCAWCFKK